MFKLNFPILHQCYYTVLHIKSPPQFKMTLRQGFILSGGRQAMHYSLEYFKEFSISWTLTRRFEEPEYEWVFGAACGCECHFSMVLHCKNSLSQVRLFVSTSSPCLELIWYGERIRPIKED